jgi:hypothetical protein
MWLFKGTLYLKRIHNMVVNTKERIVRQQLLVTGTANLGKSWDTAA